MLYRVIKDEIEQGVKALQGADNSSSATELHLNFLVPVYFEVNSELFGSRGRALAGL